MSNSQMSKDDLANRRSSIDRRSSTFRKLSFKDVLKLRPQNRPSDLASVTSSIKEITQEKDKELEKTNGAVLTSSKEADEIIIGEENIHLGSSVEQKRVTSPSSGSRTNSLGRTKVTESKLMPAIKEDEREHINRTLIEASVNETDAMPSRDVAPSFL